MRSEEEDYDLSVMANGIFENGVFEAYGKMSSGATIEDADPVAAVAWGRGAVLRIWLPI